MQALQFLKGMDKLPVQKEAYGLSNRKESSVSSFKTILEDASKKEAPQKTLYKAENAAGDEAKDASIPKETEEVSPTKKGKTSEKEAGRQASGGFTQETGQFIPAGNDAVLPLDAGETVLFGQPVEQLAMDPIVPGTEEHTGLEDVTALETVFDLRPQVQDTVMEAAQPAGLIPTRADGTTPIRQDLAAMTFRPEAGRPSLPETETDQPALADIIPDAGEQVLEENIPQNPRTAAGKRAETNHSDAGTPLADGRKPLEAATEAGSRFTIVDNRSVEAKREAGKAEGQELKAESVRQHGNTLDITFNLGQEQSQQLAAEQNILSSSDQAAAGDASSFQRMLSNQLLNQAPEFVKAGSIILRDNDNGTINLNLKPEALGNVKITLHVTDKGIEGQIVVASREAFEAFNQNMDNLKQSFRQSGFDAANLSLNLADGSAAQGQLAQGGSQGQQQSGRDYIANKTFGGWRDGEEKLSSQTIAAAYGAGGHEIDVVA